jgi:outer membrane lipoprotein-sorting protein
MKTRRLPIWAALSGLGAIAWYALPALAAPVTPERILRAQENLPYAGLMLINGARKVKVWSDGNQGQRREFLGAKGEMLDLLITDGQIRWHYLPRMRSVKVMPMEPQLNLTQRLKLLQANYQFQVIGQARKANRPVVLTRFAPLHSASLTHLLWVDQETALPLAVERRLMDGKLVDRSEYTAIDYHPKMAAKAFKFEIPAGCRVASTVTVLASGDSTRPAPRGLEFSAKTPKRMPTGYKLLSWQYFQGAHRVPTMNWRFHDGLNPVSLFAVAEKHQAHVPGDARAVGVGKVPGYLIANGAEHMLTWATQGTAYTLVGHLPEDEMIKVAESTL